MSVLVTEARPSSFNEACNQNNGAIQDTSRLEWPGSACVPSDLEPALIFSHIAWQPGSPTAASLEASWCWGELILDALRCVSGKVLGGLFRGSGHAVTLACSLHPSVWEWLTVTWLIEWRQVLQFTLTFGAIKWLVSKSGTSYGFNSIFLLSLVIEAIAWGIRA